MQDHEAIQRLQELNDQNGTLTPDAVLEDAADPSSPLHPHFTWDDSKAAIEYRRTQARTLIRSVRIVIREDSHQVKSVGYVEDPDKERGEQGYVSTASLVSDKEKARRALVNELMRAESALNRAYDVADSVGLTSEVDSLLAQIRGVRTAA